MTSKGIILTIPTYFYIRIMIGIQKLSLQNFLQKEGDLETDVNDKQKTDVLNKYNWSTSGSGDDKKTQGL